MFVYGTFSLVKVPKDHGAKIKIPNDHGEKVKIPNDHGEGIFALHSTKGCICNYYSNSKFLKIVVQLYSFYIEHIIRGF